MSLHPGEPRSCREEAPTFPGSGYRLETQPVTDSSLNLQGRQVLRVDPTRDDGLGAAVRRPPPHPWAERATLQGEQLASLGQEGAGSTAGPASAGEGAGQEEYGPHVPPWPAPGACLASPVLREGASLVPAPCTWAPGQAVLPPKPCPLEASLAPCAWRSLSPGLQVPREGKSVARDEA